MRRAAWSARCLVCDWAVAGEVRTVDLAADKHTKTGHPTVQEGLAA